MRVGILGSGLMGGKLGSILARAGHYVVFSYSRSRDRLEQLADDAGARAKAGTPAEAASDADAVLLAVHWTRIDDVLAQAGKLSGTTVLTCSLPMSKDDIRVASSQLGTPVSLTVWRDGREQQLRATLSEPFRGRSVLGWTEGLTPSSR